jgi:Galactocerebrosidase, C-terminal lectin domain
MRGALLILALTIASMLTAPAHSQRVMFAETPLNELPKDFVTALTGQGKPGKWAVVEDATAEGGRALAQLDPDPTDYRFPLAIYGPTFPSEVEITTRFKAISGKEDQAGGIIVRLIDRNNYYLARANALEDNVHFFRVVGGRRQELAGANTKVASGVWHTLTLRAEGSRFSVSFNGKQLFSHTDRTFGTPGNVALWTKADSVTHFDWVDIKPLKMR